jgi:hypothetical protein
MEGSQMKVRILGISFLTLFFASTALAVPGDEAPAWLQQATQIKTPTYDKDVPAVVLRNDQTLTVSEDGKVLSSRVYAMRILTREGREYAEAFEVYLTNSSKVKELRAWLIRPDGKVKKYGGDETVDRITDPNDVYNEYRVKVIDASNDADAGTVFGYEAVSEERPLFGQDIWNFQKRLPTVSSRFVLALPSGWQASGVTFNHPKLEPAVSGSTYSWELQNLPPIKYEPASPRTSSLAPRLAVNYFPVESGMGKPARAFENWIQVSQWGSEIHDPLGTPDETVAAKAKELTAKYSSEIEQIRAIAQFVQRLQYISIDIGVGKGNGYRPHPPAQVLAKAYGDCKDKANLMRTMLKAINISAYPVFIYLGDPTQVREEWASPSQFNHVIIAIKVSDAIKADTILQHPTLGRLLVFDATDEHTPVGDLPDEEQGSLALIVAGASGALMRMPVLPPEASQLLRDAEVDLAADGSITVSVRERSVGQAAVSERRAFRALSNPEYKTMIERWVTHGATAAKVLKVEPKDQSSENKFALDVDFSARSYGQLMQDRLLVFNPAIVSRRQSLDLTEPKRQHPIVLDSYAFTEKVRVKLPAGFAVDELPDPVKLEVAFGSYETKYEVKDGELLFTRIMAQRAGTIPAAQYQGIRTFYERMLAAEQSPVVLIRK